MNERGIFHSSEPTDDAFRPLSDSLYHLLHVGSMWSARGGEGSGTVSDNSELQLLPSESRERALSLSIVHQLASQLLHLLEMHSSPLASLIEMSSGDEKGKGKENAFTSKAHAVQRVWETYLENPIRTAVLSVDFDLLPFAQFDPVLATELIDSPRQTFTRSVTAATRAWLRMDVLLPLRKLWSQTRQSMAAAKERHSNSPSPEGVGITATTGTPLRVLHQVLRTLLCLPCSHCDALSTKNKFSVRVSQNTRPSLSFAASDPSCFAARDGAAIDSLCAVCSARWRSMDALYCGSALEVLPSIATFPGCFFRFIPPPHAFWDDGCCRRNAPSQPASPVGIRWRSGLAERAHTDTAWNAGFEGAQQNRQPSSNELPVLAACGWHPAPRSVFTAGKWTHIAGVVSAIWFPSPPTAWQGDTDAHPPKTGNIEARNWASRRQWGRGRGKSDTRNVSRSADSRCAAGGWCGDTRVPIPQVEITPIQPSAHALQTLYTVPRLQGPVVVDLSLLCARVCPHCAERCAHISRPNRNSGGADTCKAAAWLRSTVVLGEIVSLTGVVDVLLQRPVPDEAVSHGDELCGESGVDSALNWCVNHTAHDPAAYSSGTQQSHGHAVTLVVATRLRTSRGVCWEGMPQQKSLAAANAGGGDWRVWHDNASLSGATSPSPLFSRNVLCALADIPSAVRSYSLQGALVQSRANEFPSPFDASFADVCVPSTLLLGNCYEHDARDGIEGCVNTGADVDTVDWGDLPFHAPLTGTGKLRHESCDEDMETAEKHFREASLVWGCLGRAAVRAETESNQNGGDSGVWCEMDGGAAAYGKARVVATPLSLWVALGICLASAPLSGSCVSLAIIAPPTTLSVIDTFLRALNESTGGVVFLRRGSESALLPFYSGVIAKDLMWESETHSDGGSAETCTNYRWKQRPQTQTTRSSSAAVCGPHEVVRAGLVNLAHRRLLYMPLVETLSRGLLKLLASGTVVQQRAHAVPAPSACGGDTNQETTAVQTHTTTSLNVAHDIHGSGGGASPHGPCAVVRENGQKVLALSESAVCLCVSAVCAALEKEVRECAERCDVVVSCTSMAGVGVGEHPPQSRWEAEARTICEGELPAWLACSSDSNVLLENPSDPDAEWITVSTAFAPRCLQIGGNASPSSSRPRRRVSSSVSHFRSPLESWVAAGDPPPLSASAASLLQNYFTAAKSLHPTGVYANLMATLVRVATGHAAFRAALHSDSNYERIVGLVDAVVAIDLCDVSLRSRCGTSLLGVSFLSAVEAEGDRFHFPTFAEELRDHLQRAVTTAATRSTAT